MAVMLAVVLSLLSVEVAMSRRTPHPTSPDPASLALLHPRHPHAAGIDVGAAELWVCVPPGAVAVAPRPAVLPAPVRRCGAFTAALQAIAAGRRQWGVTTVAMASTGV
jgi:transposase